MLRGPTGVMFNCDWFESVWLNAVFQLLERKDPSMTYIVLVESTLCILSCTGTSCLVPISCSVLCWKIAEMQWALRCVAFAGRGLGCFCGRLRFLTLDLFPTAGLITRCAINSYCAGYVVQELGE